MKQMDHPIEDRLEGKNPVLEALKAHRPIHKLWVAKQSQPQRDIDREQIIKLAKLAGAAVIETKREILDKMAVSHSHQGVIAQFAAHEYALLETVLESAADCGRMPMLLILDRLQDSYNLGSILRIADAAGADGVIIPRHRSVGLDAVAAKASAGASEHVPVIRVGNISQTLDLLKKDGFWIYGTSHAADKHYSQTDFTGKIAIVIGSEGEGMSRQVEEHCDFLLHIPMKGKINSLNAAVAAGIIVFEAVRQRSEDSHGRKDQSN